MVLQSVHQVGGLDHQGFYAVLHSPVQGLLHIVNGDIVPAFHMINDNLAGKAPPDRILWECFFHGIFNGANGQPSAVIVAGAKADHQQFLLPDTILIPGVVQRGVPSVWFLLCLHRLAVLFRRYILLLWRAASGQHRHQERPAKQQCKQFLSHHFIPLSMACFWYKTLQKTAAFPRPSLHQ